MSQSAFQISLGACRCHGAAQSDFMSRVAARAGARPSTCAPRAALDMPQPGGAGGADDPQSSLSAARAALERSLHLELPASPEDGGKCDCIWCNGTGERCCAWCKGKGTRQEFLSKSWEALGKDIEGMINDGQPVKLPEQVPTVCSACSGSRRLPCSYCRGSGIGSYGMGYRSK